MPRQSNRPLAVPFTVLIDQQEGLPYRFQGIRADADRSCRPLVIPTRTVHLKTGDYSIEGLESEISVERKSLTDWYRTLGQERDRFKREIQRLSMMQDATVMIEASWPEILFHPPDFARLHPKAIHRTVIAWRRRYPTVHWWPAGDRRLAEITTFRILERYWNERTSQRGG